MSTYLPYHTPSLKPQFGYLGGFSVRYVGSVGGNSNEPQRYGYNQSESADFTRNYDRRTSGGPYLAKHNISAEDGITDFVSETYDFTAIYQPAPSLGVTLIADIFLPTFSPDYLIIVDAMTRVPRKLGFLYYGLTLYKSANYLGVNVGADGSLVSAEALTPQLFGRWSQLAIVMQGLDLPGGAGSTGPTSGSVRTYINGDVLQDLCFLDIPTLPSVTTYTIGQNQALGATTNYPMRLGQSAIFGCSMNNNQIRAMYNTHRSF